MRILSLKMMTLLATTGLILVSAMAAQAFNPNATDTADATAQVEILKPVRLIHLESNGLHFGTIVANTGGTVTVSPTNTRTSNGVSVVESSFYSAAQFEVSGNPASYYTIALPSSTTLSSGANSMTVDAFTSNPSGLGLLDVDGNGAFQVGGTLHVNPSQPVGHYTGSFSVTVAYN